MSGSGPWSNDGAKNIVGAQMLTAVDPPIFSGFRKRIFRNNGLF